MGKLLLASRKISNFFPGTILFPKKKNSEGKIYHLRKGNHLDSLSFITSFFHELFIIYNAPDPDVDPLITA